MPEWQWLCCLLPPGRPRVTLVCASGELWLGAAPVVLDTLEGVVE